MQKLLNHSIFVRDESRCNSPDPQDEVHNVLSPWPPIHDVEQRRRISSPKGRPFTSLPRQTTFKRQNSERRDRLCPNEPLVEERRAASASRQPSTSCVGRRRTRSSPPPNESYHSSAPALSVLIEPPTPAQCPSDRSIVPSEELSSHGMHFDSVFDYEVRSSRPVSRASSVCFHDEDQQRQLQLELDTKWILNLSMHFRDKSDREKFFVTYAHKPTHWRRLTVSCDYRKAERNSLEWDLRELQFQRDKSFAIYEAIRESLPEIQFYDTVTNLKLETTDARLHVHVTEDVNEIIQYPPKSMLRHILDGQVLPRPMEVHEGDLEFEAHLSGFVYRIRYKDKVFIKKEIPSPDTVDEFLYEINALHALSDSKHVIKLEAIVLDDTGQTVRGLLLSHASQGAIVDLLYENKGRIPWDHRELWARQAITGLRDIHEEGYIQGDFTLSNIVVDEDNNAQIIDINRRGCPVGWEPPEIAQKIASNQRISMYIGEKSDLYQLGMTLWALAMDDDEPERHDPPLLVDEFPPHIPQYFRRIVRSCLATRPRDRLSAKALVDLFPAHLDDDEYVAPPVYRAPIRCPTPAPQPREPSSQRSETKQYIDPLDAVERDDLERYREEELLSSPQSSKDDWTFTYPQSSQFDMESTASVFDRDADNSTNYKYSSRPSNVSYRETDPRDDDYLNLAIRTPLPLSNQVCESSQSTPTKSFDIGGLGIICGPEVDGKSTSLTAGTTKSDIELTMNPFQRSCRKSISMGVLASKEDQTSFDSDTLHLSPSISPFTTTFDLPRRPASAQNSSTARDSSETMIAYDSVATRPSLSDVTARKYSSNYDRVTRTSDRNHSPDVLQRYDYEFVHDEKKTPNAFHEPEQRLNELTCTVHDFTTT